MSSASEPTAITGMSPFRLSVYDYSCIEWMTDGEAMGFQPLTIAQGHVGFILGVPNGIILPIHISNNPQLGKHRVFVK